MYGLLPDTISIPPVTVEPDWILVPVIVNPPTSPSVALICDTVMVPVVILSYTNEFISAASEAI